MTDHQHRGDGHDHSDDRHDHHQHEHHQHTDHSGHGGHDHHGGHAGHADEFRRKFWISLILTIPIIIMAPMLQHWFNYSIPAFPGDSLVSAFLGTILFVYGGRIFLEGAIDELKVRQPGMMTLISLAITVAFLASWTTTLGWLDLDFWWELALLITVMLLGHWVEMGALGESQSALQALADLVPDQAERIVNGETEMVPVTNLELGDLLLVRPGGSIPADGVVESGTAELDESMITGESTPVTRTEGDRVVAGSVVGGSSIRLRVDASGDDTVLAGIQRMVAEAQNSKSRTQALADKAAALLFYIALASSIATFFVWWLWIGNLDEAITRTVAVLVIACPHALGLAIPLVIAITTEVAAKNGVVIRDRMQLERMREVTNVLWDKTGTLTQGSHEVQALLSLNGSDDMMLATAAAVERDSEHPLATAIVNAADERSLEIPAAADFTARAGRGVSAIVDGDKWIIGGLRVVEESATELPAEIQSWQSEWKDRGSALLYMVNDGEVEGAIALADAVRDESFDAISRLKEEGVTSTMMTGDAKAVADAVAGEIGIAEVYAEVLPEDKQRVVKERQSEGDVVAMVGDGVNDAPALAMADVGLAIGAGTDVAIQSAGIILASSDPRTVPGVRRLSNAMYRKMIQNLWWAAGYNILAIPVAAGLFAPWGINMPPAAAAVLMSLSTIIVALNAQTLRGFKFIEEWSGIP